MHNDARCTRKRYARASVKTLRRRTVELGLQGVSENHYSDVQDYDSPANRTPRGDDADQTLEQERDFCDYRPFFFL
eukprot:1117322-Amphidinium_carterae.1